MASVEGIIFSDLFINDKQYFVNIFSQYYKANEERIKPVIMNLEAVLTQYTAKSLTPAMASSFKAAWKEFENVVLLNEGDLQLLVAYRGQAGRNPEFSTIVKQEDVEGEGQTPRGRQYGIQTGRLLAEDSDYMLKSREVENYLRIHLNGFLNQLEQTINKSTAEKIHDYHEYCLANYLQNSEEHITGKQWYEAFYTQSAGQYFGGAGLGQAYDAFMNHLANKEKGIYDFLASNGLQDTSMQKMGFKSQSVYVEEGGVEGPYPSSAFAELLKASRNHIGWYTGGDIIIVNPKTMQVVYNIQLKTTTRNSATIFGERVESIRKFLKGFLELSPEQKGEKVFDFFLTAVSNADDFNSMPQYEAEHLIQEELTKKMDRLQIHLNF